ncbi:hypothetical protein [Thermomicrobium sp.]|jgi:hypothetical protein|uniref:hypothetical protein n=1 Tax=Thermomicrobium sp. TaxID=1969469 RepID=UPI001B166D41|nr:hypothetical protein [Thermomicrobium sp.]MBO9306480.1 hypothetical protein [Thermomicrobium sp.]
MTERSEHELDRAMARLKRLGIVLPLAFLAALVVIGHALVPVLGATWAWIASGTLAVLGVVVFAEWIFLPDRCTLPPPPHATCGTGCPARSWCGDHR